MSIKLSEVKAAIATGIRPSEVAISSPKKLAEIGFSANSAAVDPTKVALSAELKTEKSSQIG